MGEMNLYTSTVLLLFEAVESKRLTKGTFYFVTSKNIYSEIACEDHIIGAI